MLRCRARAVAKSLLGQTDLCNIVMGGGNSKPKTSGISGTYRCEKTLTKVVAYLLILALFLNQQNPTTRFRAEFVLSTKEHTKEMTEEEKEQEEKRGTFTYKYAFIEVFNFFFFFFRLFYYVR